jgi:adenosylcobyric acid synthase
MGRRRGRRDWRPGTWFDGRPAGASWDALGDLVADHLDTEAVLALLHGGAPEGLRFVPPGAP